MDFDFEQHDLIRVILSILCGSLIGFEREYKNKSAGFRTLILICMGSTIFTIVSQRASGESDDRIAANIITGIGFIGAGVIFKDGLNVKGLTTAAVIWVVAALGMVIALFHYSLSIILTFIVLLILSVFNKVESFIDYINHQKTFNVTFKNDDLGNLLQLEQEAEKRGLKSRRIRLSKSLCKLNAVFEISGRKKELASFNTYLVELPSTEEVLAN
ncbi:MgtC/SapB family protein [Desertivirga xinjiangensis]|uniref:MgtC/SapB family protein n=1 Tax=Desertivirga xinjiangensis TaxID=539206 RepID=UPI00210A0675|nr:MgtC/SapB family protein [Pedobacter xinjiangensis]